MKKRTLGLGLAAAGILLVGVTVARLWLGDIESQKKHAEAELQSNQETMAVRVRNLESTRTDFSASAHFAPWQLTTTDPARVLDPYLSNGNVGVSVGADGRAVQWALAGRYEKGALVKHTLPKSGTDPVTPTISPSAYRQELDLRSGVVTTRLAADGKPVTRRVWLDPPAASPRVAGNSESLPTNVRTEEVFSSAADAAVPAHAPLPFWQNAGIEIVGDPEAQQMVDAAQFYLLSSVAPGQSLAPPPLGLLDERYHGHLFWDGDVWMLPALLPQHPTYARALTQFRFRTLGQARRNAAQQGMAGAKYAWESDSDGHEQASGKFLQELHVDGAAAWGAWQYYIWTGDTANLRTEVWPILQATAQYWTAVAKPDASGGWHIRQVIGPDENRGAEDDDVYTNALVQWNLRTADRVARLLHFRGDAHWNGIANGLYLRHSRRFDIPACSDSLDASSLSVDARVVQKQASVVLLAYPLHALHSQAEIGRMLDFYAPRTDPTAPAMSDSIHSIIAAQLGRDTQALQFFRASYRPYLRAPWAAMSETRKQIRVPFLTGMGGCLQSVLYGFAGLRVFEPGETPIGTRLMQDNGFILCASPHLPASWKRLRLTGLHFHGRTLDVTILPHNRIVTTETHLQH